MFERFKKHTAGGPEYLIVGLGNPGLQYQRTRHNVGFMAVDTLADSLGFTVGRLKYEGMYGECSIAGKRCLAVKPQTYMNDSGRCVAAFASFYKIPPEKIIVIFDDISLDVGALRIRRKGSHGGHNGVKDITYTINSEEFPRIKIGIGAKPHPSYNLADWVLSKFSENEFEAIGKACKQCEAIVTNIVNGQIDRAMNECNR